MKHPTVTKSIRIMHEVQSRNFVILEEDRFLEQLEFPAKSFDDPALESAITRIRDQG